MFVNLKDFDNINIIPESIEIINNKNKNDSKNANTKYKKVTKKTVPVAGDSMVNAIEESKLSKMRHIPVQPKPGGKIEDIQQNLKALLHDDLETVIIHTGTYNTTTDTKQMIVDKLITFKRNIEGLLQKCRIIISKLILRTDSTKANTTVQNTNRLIKELQILTANNSNISEQHLGNRGLYLNQEGNTVFASNLLHAIRNF